MADDFAAVAVVQHATPPAADERRAIPLGPPPHQSERVERGIELLSRWAGIVAFVGTVGGIAYLIT